MSILRAVALILILGPLAAMLTEPFFESLLDQLGWSSENFAVPAMIWVANNQAVLFGVMGLGLGVWAHFFATKILHRKMENALRDYRDADKINPVQDNFENLRINLADFAGHINQMSKNKRFINCELTSPTPILLNGTTTLQGSSISDCDFIIVKENKPISNAVGFDDPQFFNCRFSKVTFYVSQSVAQSLALSMQNTTAFFLSESFDKFSHTKVEFQPTPSR